MKQRQKSGIPTVAIVIPLFFSSGALSISSKAIALALPSSASTYDKEWKCVLQTIYLQTQIQEKWGFLGLDYHYAAPCNLSLGHFSLIFPIS